MSTRPSPGDALKNEIGMTRPVVDPDYTATIALDQDQTRALLAAAYAGLAGARIADRGSRIADRGSRIADRGDMTDRLLELLGLPGGRALGSSLVVGWLSCLRVDSPSLFRGTITSSQQWLVFEQHLRTTVSVREADPERLPGKSRGPAVRTGSWSWCCSSWASPLLSAC